MPANELILEQPVHGAVVAMPSSLHKGRTIGVHTSVAMLSNATRGEAHGFVHEADLWRLGHAGHRGWCSVYVVRIGPMGPHEL